MAVSELPGNPNAVWTVKTHKQGLIIVTCTVYRIYLNKRPTSN